MLRFSHPLGSGDHWLDSAAGLAGLPSAAGIPGPGLHSGATTGHYAPFKLSRESSLKLRKDRVGRTQIGFKDPQTSGTAIRR